MTIDVLLFAQYAEALGSSIALELPEEATVETLLATLALMPGAERLPPKPLVAVNQRYARAHDRIQASDEVAVIPPAAGG